MLSLLAFVVVAVGLATPFVVPLMWGQLEKPGISFLNLPVKPRSSPTPPVPRFRTPLGPPPAGFFSLELWLLSP